MDFQLNQDFLKQALQAYHSGHFQKAISFYHQHLELNPEDIESYYELARVFQQLNQLDKALEVYQKIISIQPNDMNAHSSLGLLYGQLQKFEASIHHFLLILKLEPNQPAILANLGTNYLNSGQYQLALNSYQQALKLNPKLNQIHFNLGNLYVQTGQSDLAIVSYQRVIKTMPELIIARQKLAEILLQKQRYTEAIEQYLYLLQSHPTHYVYSHYLGDAYRESGQFEKAIEYYQLSLSHNPDNHIAMINMGIALRELGQLEAAVNSFQSALKFEAHYIAYHNLGLTLRDLGQYGSAIEAYQQTLALQSDFYLTHSSLGVTYMEVGEVEKALKHFQQSIQLKPDYWVAHMNRLFCMAYQADLSAEEHFQACLETGKALEKRASVRTYSPSPEVNTRLRIGYVSPDFRRHAAEFTIEALLRHHDRQEFEVFSYAQVPHPDEMTQKFIKLSEHWRWTQALNDEEMAENIRQDRIHILIDLAGHTAQNRLGVFACKPSPIQLTLYPMTSGLSAIDYRLVDSYLLCEELKSFNSEELLALNTPFLCFYPPSDAPEPGEIPELKNGYITFASFNNLSKVNPGVIKFWSQILSEYPSAKLLLKYKAFGDPSVQNQMAQQFLIHGIGRERLQFYGSLSYQEHLKLYNQVDIALDPFPFNGHTTTCEALWMGVPVVSVLSPREFGRAGLSLLSRVGLEEFVAQNQKEYLGKLNALINDRDKRIVLRSELRERLRQSSLCQSENYVKELERGYVNVWETWCEQARA